MYELCFQALANFRLFVNTWTHATCIYPYKGSRWALYAFIWNQKDSKDNECFLKRILSKKLFSQSTSDGRNNFHFFISSSQALTTSWRIGYCCLKEVSIFNQYSFRNENEHLRVFSSLIFDSDVVFLLSLSLFLGRGFYHGEEMSH